MTANRWVRPARRVFGRALRKCAQLLALTRRLVPGGGAREARLYARIENILNGAPSARSRGARPLLPLIPSLVRQVLSQGAGYRAIFTERLTADDRRFLAENGLSEAYIRANSGDPSDPLRFQRQALARGRLDAICPWTGRTLESDRSVLAAESQPIYYRFVCGNGSGRVFYLAVGREGTGNGTLYFYLPNERLVLFFADPHLWNGTAEIDQIRAYSIVRWRPVLDYFGRGEGGGVCALVDSNHFAHHLWEDLSGISGLLNDGLLQRVETLVVASEPMGPIAALFPEIPAEKIEHAVYPGLVDDALVRGRCLIRFGGLSIHPSLVERAYRCACLHAEEGAVAQAAAMRDACWPVLWVTVRIGNRTWVSQVDGIAGIANALYREYPRLALIVDGYSVPDGRPRIHPRTELETVRAERACVEEIRLRLTPGLTLASNVGRSMSAAIVFARAADLYLAHHGSLQHKVAWIANCPGVVHSNRGVLDGPLERHRGLFAREDAVVPVYLDPERVQDRPGARDVPNNRWAYDLDNYDFDYNDALHALRRLLRDSKPRPLAVGD